jgi:hypothetical protein
VEDDWKRNGFRQANTPTESAPTCLPQSLPLFAAMVGSASDNTNTGDLPPSSRMQGFKFSPDMRPMCFPTAELPVCGDVRA